MRNLTFLIFVAMTFVCWGTYGPTLHQGQSEMGADGKLSLLRPIICVGIAYFLIAVLFPLSILLTRGEPGKWSLGGFWWSFIAGALGAFGALGITLAFKFQGKPIFVMPLVFGCAPIMNTLVTMTMAKTFRQANMLFMIGIVMVALGAAGVLVNKPSAKKTADRQHPPMLKNFQALETRFPVVLNASTSQGIEAPKQLKPSVAKNGGVSDEAASRSSTGSAIQQEPAQLKSPASQPSDEPNSMKQALTGATNWFMVILGIATTGICWGAYGPVLHKGQAKMAGSRLRPFLCVGLAYFAIAVVIPYWFLTNYPEPGTWLGPSGWLSVGAVWSLGAGALGALGALGIIYAFNFGGKPVFVMPLVFGFAPVINTLVEATSKGLLGEIKPMFYLSLGLVILGAIMVLVFAPKTAPKTVDNSSTQFANPAANDLGRRGQ
jgi:hypothetical protein